MDDGESGTRNRREGYRMQTGSTAIDDWLICDERLSASAYRMASHILRHQKNGDPPPTRDDLAQDMRVDTRSVARWLDELRDAQLLKTERDGRRNVYGFMKPRRQRKYDRKITDKKITDLSVIDKRITDLSITDPSVILRDSVAVESGARTKGDDSVIVAPVGGGGDHDSPEKESPTPTRGPLKTNLGRYMARKRFGAAPEFDDPALDEGAHIRAIEAMEREGLPKDRIIYFLRLDPPTAETYPPPERQADAVETQNFASLLAQPLPDAQAEIVPSIDEAQLVLVRLWNDVLSTLQAQTSHHQFNTWLRATRLVAIAGDTATIEAPNDLIKGGIESHYTSAIRSLINMRGQHVRTVVVRVQQ
jgi:hypothetical protein